MKIVAISTEELKQLIEESVKKVLEQNNTPLEEPPKVDDTEMYTRKDIQKIFNVSLATVNSWSNKKILNRVRINSRIYYLKSEVDELILKQKMKRK